jgi:hypothetical protein
MGKNTSAKIVVGVLVWLYDLWEISIGGFPFLCTRVNSKQPLTPKKKRMTLSAIRFFYE